MSQALNLFLNKNLIITSKLFIMNRFNQIIKAIKQTAEALARLGELYLILIALLF
jgi:hypothetical protein